MRLSDYILDTRALVNDQAGLFVSTTQLTRWINTSRREIAKQMGCIRRHLTGQSAFGASAQPGTFIPGAAQPGALPGAFPAAFNTSGGPASQNAFQCYPNVERYPFTGFGNPYLKAAHAGCEEIIDVGMVSVAWGGTPKPALDWCAWEDFQAYYRSYGALLTSYPAIFTVYQDGTSGEVWLAPVPSQPMDMEWDCFCLPSALNSDDDYDAIPSGYQNQVKFAAASFVCLSQSKYADAEMFEGLAGLRGMVNRAASDRGKVPSFYGL